MDVLDVEIDRHPWSEMGCGCGRSGEHIPMDFLRSLEAPPPERAGEGWADGHAFVQSNLTQPAVATASIIMAALVRGVPGAHHRQLMLVLHALVNGEQDDTADECLRVVRGGIWSLYEEIASARNIDAAAYAFEILEQIEEESDRLADYRSKIRDNLPADLW
ncbi:hypothetical protein [Streptomyces fodineus]|uniref:hypothetical protein n=1 Tax=Streptomyces fodineus TaxID=1904616 RepID=UPI00131D38CA|nr:hypothetical protein [Streptomyces fodineus]